MPSFKNSFKTFYAISFAWQLGFFIIIPVAVFLSLGFLADNFFKTKPLFLIVGIVVSFIAIIYGVYFLLRPLIKNPKGKKLDNKKIK